MNPTFKFAVREELKDSEFNFLPTKGEPNATGWDVRCSIKDGIFIEKGHYVKIPLGFRSIVPDGWWYELRPRSSTFLKKQINSLYGVIDQDFPHECCFVGQWLPCESRVGIAPLYIPFGEPIGQIIPVERQEMNVEEITNEQCDQFIANRNAKRTGGFGSTG